MSMTTSAMQQIDHLSVDHLTTVVTAKSSCIDVYTPQQHLLIMVEV